MLVVAVAEAAVAVSGASAGKPTPPRAEFYANWNGGPTCVYSVITATCNATASAWWANAPSVRSVVFSFDCQSGYSGSGDYTCYDSVWNPTEILVNSRVPGSSGGSANTGFSFQEFGGCVSPGYFFEAYFLDSRGRTVGTAYSYDMSSCLL